jgi:hypothetical protein
MTLESLSVAVAIRLSSFSFRLKFSPVDVPAPRCLFVTGGGTSG